MPGEPSRFGKLEELSLDGLVDASRHLDSQVLDCVGCWYEALVLDDVDEKRRLEAELLRICAARRSLRVEVEARRIEDGLAL